VFNGKTSVTTASAIAGHDADVIALASTIASASAPLHPLLIIVPCADLGTTLYSTGYIHVRKQIILPPNEGSHQRAGSGRLAAWVRLDYTIARRGSSCSSWSRAAEKEERVE
jgi:hypothetical protein